MKYFITNVLTAAVLLGFIFLHSSCNDSSIIGTSLFDDKSISIGFTDTISITTKSITGDTSIYSDRRVYLIGKEHNDIFGDRTAKLYLNIERGIAPPKNYVGATVDSAVLVMYYDTLGIDESSINFKKETFKVYQLDERFPSSAQINLNIPHTNIINNVSGTTKTISIRDSLKLKYYKTDIDSSITVSPQLRIPLEAGFIQTLIDTDTSTAGIDTTFSIDMRGLCIEAEGDANGIIGFNFKVTNVLKVYFNIGDTAKYIHNYPIGKKRYNYFEHDYSTATNLPNESNSISNYINSNNSSDSILFVESMYGADIEVDFSSIENYKDKLLNYAEIEFYVNEDMQGDILLANNILSLYNDGENYKYSVDAEKGLDNSLYSVIHDGYLKEDDNGIKKYRIILTSHLIKFLKDDSLDKKLVFSVLNKSSKTSKAIIYGSNHSNYPARLKVVFTTP